MRSIIIGAVVALVVVACGALDRAVNPGPASRCGHWGVECSAGQGGGCCGPGEECRAAIPSEGRGPSCAYVDPRGDVHVGARRDGGAP